MIRDERVWWAVLVRACEQQATEIERHDMDAWMRAHEVEMVARGELVRLGINLDDVFPDADAEFLRLCEAAERRAKAAQEQLADAERSLADAKAFLAKHEAP